MSKVTIIIPAYNEETRIAKTLSVYAEFFKNYADDVVLLVVPNGCRDKTVEVVFDWQKKYPNLIKSEIISEAVGKGGAIIHGLSVASGDWVGFVDADGATSPFEYSKIILAAKTADGAIAARWRKDSTVIGRDSFLRKAASKVFVILSRLFLGLPYHDTQCGAKVFKKAAVLKILPYLTIKNMAIDIQILYVLKRLGFRIIEIPTVWTEVAGSAMLGNRIKFFKQSWNMLKSIFKIKFQKI